MEKGGAERFEILRHAGGEIGQRGGRRSLLGDHDLEIGSVERQAPRNALKEHDAHAVPVARGSHRLSKSLFRSHVGRRAQYLAWSSETPVDVTPLPSAAAWIMT